MDVQAFKEISEIVVLVVGTPFIFFGSLIKRKRVLVVDTPEMTLVLMAAVVILIGIGIADAVFGWYLKTLILGVTAWRVYDATDIVDPDEVVKEEKKEPPE